MFVTLHQLTNDFQQVKLRSSIHVQLPFLKGDGREFVTEYTNSVLNLSRHKPGGLTQKPSSSQLTMSTQRPIPGLIKI